MFIFVTTIICDSLRLTLMNPINIAVLGYLKFSEFKCKLLNTCIALFSILSKSESV